MEHSQSSAFLWIGNHWVVDFINTRKMSAGTRLELLPTFQDIRSWLQESGRGHLIRGLELPLAAEQENELHHEILGLRRRLEEGFESLLRGETWPDENMRLLWNEALQRYSGCLQVLGEPSPFRTERLYTLEHLPGLFWEEAALFLQSLEPGKLKRCENHACILYFYDNSRNQSRRWCSMAGCGNRIKVGMHYKRKKKTASEGSGTEPV
ncbi:MULTISPECIES: CGNR zinc finger domain-containing protein [Paenibacillus]|uniref:CGNR zinc finger domain-containing protein n=1 Tax=Paenibacillus TaxID=44249 RepID=UPI0022B86CC2|nr:CGNR zinc finger domain-containing protein [Paenibacillus caseinilyticus]MCZ8519954.1 CGNR zinc finger domain-containing protein [Paenibacillus caseinilyticus]